LPPHPLMTRLVTARTANSVYKTDFLVIPSSFYLN
jgi:hypothetical protein